MSNGNKTIYARIKPRRGTASEWEAANPTLEEGEFAIESPNTGIGTGICKFKIGDGVHNWKQLRYAFDGSAASAIFGGSAETGSVIQIRSDTNANWMNSSTVLNNKELAYDSTYGRFKMGDGVSTWKNLFYTDEYVIVTNTNTNAPYTTDNLSYSNAGLLAKKSGYPYYAAYGTTGAIIYDSATNGQQAKYGQEIILGAQGSYINRITNHGLTISTSTDDTVFSITPTSIQITDSSTKQNLVMSNTGIKLSTVSETLLSIGSTTLTETTSNSAVTDVFNDVTVGLATKLSKTAVTDMDTTNYTDSSTGNDSSALTAILVISVQLGSVTTTRELAIKLNSTDNGDYYRMTFNKSANTVTFSKNTNYNYLLDEDAPVAYSNDTSGNSENAENATISVDYDSAGYLLHIDKASVTYIGETKTSVTSSSISLEIPSIVASKTVTANKFITKNDMYFSSYGTDGKSIMDIIGYTKFGNYTINPAKNGTNVNINVSSTGSLYVVSGNNVSLQINSAGQVIFPRLSNTSYKQNMMVGITPNGRLVTYQYSVFYLRSWSEKVYKALKAIKNCLLLVDKDYNSIHNRIKTHLDQYLATIPHWTE